MKISKYITRSLLALAATACSIGALQSCSDEDIPDNSAPTLSVDEASSVLRKSVILHGSISGTNDKLKDYGFEYSESENFPSDKTTQVSMMAEGVSAQVTKQVTDLSPDETYYYRMYATTGATTVYSNKIQFRTANMSAPQISQVVTDSVGERVVRIGFSIEDYGNEVLTEVGVGYKKSSDKTYIPVAADEISADDQYLIQITGLDADTQYDFRPYAKNAADAEGTTGTIEGYGEVVVQKTAALLSADVETVEIVSGNIGINSVKIVGKVLSAKGSDGEITGCGFVWSSTIKAPTIDLNDGGVAINPQYDELPYTFSADITGLEQSSTYYICAYATNMVEGAERIAYGEVREFTTENLSTPLLDYIYEKDENGYNVYNYEQTATSIQVKAYIKNYDGPACAEKGILWSQSQGDITIDKAGDNKLVINSNDNQIVGVINNLSFGAAYYVRAYAIYKSGDQQTIGYTNTMSCNTESFNKPYMDDVAVDYEKVTRNSAELVGRISSSGNGTITERGFVLSYVTTTYEPTLENCDLTATSDESFVSVVTGLKSNTEYAVRSYVKCTLGEENETVYSGWRTCFTTRSIEWPTFNTLNVDEEKKGVNSIPVSCGIASMGDCTLIERGFCWIKDNGIYIEPTLEECTGSQAVTDGTDKSFAYTITGLAENSYYRYRAYAKVKVDETTSVVYSGTGGTYTMSYQEPNVSVGASDFSYHSAILEGQISDGNLPITERGFVLSTQNSEVILSNAELTYKADESFKVTADNLKYGTYYYARAYIVCQKGSETITRYSGWNSFSTSSIESPNFTNYKNQSTLTSLTLTVTLTTSNEGTLVARGFCAREYKGEYQEPTINDLIVEEALTGDVNEEYTLTLDGLSMSTSYIVRPYARIKVDGEEVVFYGGTWWSNTDGLGVDLSAKPGETTCEVEVRIISEVDTTEWKYGLIWSSDRESDKSTWTKVACNNMNAERTFSGTLTGLSAAQTYYVSTYFTVNGKTCYIDGVWEFTTKRKPTSDDNTSPDKKD